MKTKKKHIDTYSTNIYPIDIVVANEPVQLKDLQKLYTYSDNDELNGSIINGLASCSACIRRLDNTYVILIKFNKVYPTNDRTKAENLIDTIAHESLHAALDMFDYVDATVDTKNQEPLAYLIGFIASCVYRTLIKK
jgi:hypothetical protein